MFEVKQSDYAVWEEYHGAGERAAGAWPSAVISLPTAQYTVMDVDSLLEDICDSADAFVKTERGIQWVWCRPWCKDPLVCGADDNFDKCSTVRGSYDMRVFDKALPRLRRSMVGITKAGKALAAEWNETAASVGWRQP